MAWPKVNPALLNDTSRIQELTPYERASGEWDNRIGSARVQAKNWRLMALLCALAATFAVCGVLYLTLVRPFNYHIVEVDTTGKPIGMRVSHQVLNPSDAHIAYILAQLVELVRERPLDPVVIRSNWKKAYAFLAGEAIEIMNVYASEHSGLGLNGGTSAARMVTVTSVVKSSDITYQVHWTETTFIEGVPEKARKYTGVFHCAIEQPRNEEELFRNPFGLYVTSFNWSRDFTADELTETSSVSTHQQPSQRSKP